MNRRAGNQAVTAIVLAAGMSRRMGVPKQLLPSGDKTLVERVLESVGNSSVGEIVLVLGHAADQIREQIPGEGIRIIVNKAYQEGMGSSLRVGIGAIGSDTQAALIVLADQPFVRSATLDRMIEHYQGFRPQIILPTYRGFRGNPVLLDRSVFAEVATVRGDIGCRAIFGNHLEEIARLEVDDPGILLDVDTPEDLERLATSACLPGVPPTPPAQLEIRTPLSEADAQSVQPELVVVGKDAVGIALVKLARLLGFTTTVVDAFLSPGALPEADRILHVLDFSLLPECGDRSFVVASRGQFDEEALEQALGSDALYVGLLAGSKRSEALRESLRRKGISNDRLGRIHAPAGVQIGAQEPGEIALSILAEVVEARRRGEQKSEP